MVDTPMRLFVLLAIFVASACRSVPPPPAREPAAPDRPTHVQPAPAVEAVPSNPPEADARATAEPASTAGCEVAVETSLVPLAPGRFELVVTAVNRTDRPIRTFLLHPCPGPAAQFEGLPPGYDVGDRCRAGACRGGATSRAPLTLSEGGASEIARVQLDTGPGSCNAALAPGRYSIGATVDLEGVRSCSTVRASLDNTSPTDEPARVE